MRLSTTNNCLNSYHYGNSQQQHEQRYERKQRNHVAPHHQGGTSCNHRAGTQAPRRRC
nr:MAG TPA: hypothetical protein [Ackermannviridae sp.]